MALSQQNQQPSPDRAAGLLAAEFVKQVMDGAIDDAVLEKHCSAQEFAALDKLAREIDDLIHRGDDQGLGVPPLSNGGDLRYLDYFLETTPEAPLVTKCGDHYGVSPAAAEAVKRKLSEKTIALAEIFAAIAAKGVDDATLAPLLPQAAHGPAMAELWQKNGAPTLARLALKAV